MKQLTLKKTGALYGRPWWTFSKDYLVLDAGLIIGRIIWNHAGPKDRCWFWTINTRRRQSAHDFGYSQSRRRAMADFKAQWLSR